MDTQRLAGGKQGAPGLAEASGKQAHCSRRCCYIGIVGPPLDKGRQPRVCELSICARQSSAPKGLPDVAKAADRSLIAAFGVLGRDREMQQQVGGRLPAGAQPPLAARSLAVCPCCSPASWHQHAHMRNAGASPSGGVYQRSRRAGQGGAARSLAHPVPPDLGKAGVCSAGLHAEHGLHPQQRVQLPGGKSLCLSSSYVTPLCHCAPSASPLPAPGPSGAAPTGSRLQLHRGADAGAQANGPGGRQRRVGGLRVQSFAEHGTQHDALLPTKTLSILSAPVCRLQAAAALNCLSGKRRQGSCKAQRNGGR